MVTIRQPYLDAFWSQKTGTVKGNITMFSKMVLTAKEELDLEDFPLFCDPTP